MDIPASLLVEFDWKQFMFILFSITNIIFNIVKLFVTFFRPFMSKYVKLKMIWVGQTVLYYQLLTYTGLTPGAFGWTIDEAQKGMIKSTRSTFFANSVIGVDKEIRFW